MRVADDVRQAFAYGPAEQLLVNGVDNVDGARKVGGDADGPQQLSSGGQFSGERHVAIAGDGGTHVGERLPGQGLDLGDFLKRLRRDRPRRAGAPGRLSP